MLVQEPSRKIVISSEINEDVAQEVIERIMEINDIDFERSQALKDYEPEPIEIFINSVGGSVFDGLAIISAIRMSSTPVVAYAMGLVASMSLAIFVSADVRLATKYARFMYHSVGYGMLGKLQEHRDGLRESEILQRMYDNIMLERTKMTKEFMKKIVDKKDDFFFSSTKAIELGVADEIIQQPEKKF